MKEKRACRYGLLILLLGASVSFAKKPNILLIYTDDVGFGDLSCYGATKVSTPNCDKLAAEGVRFTDAHTVAATCTPSRYSLLTGRYAFRDRGTGIASPVDGLIIDPNKTTLPGMLRDAGYATGIVGKWHLGLGTKPTNYNEPITRGPKEVGFDYSWIIPATGDRVPCVWMEDGHIVNYDPNDPITIDPTVNRRSKESLIKGIPRIGSMKGGVAALWTDDEISFVIADKSCGFIEKNKDVPWFLYMSTHSIHVPRVPNEIFVGKSDCGVRGDALVEMDWQVGRILAQLDKLGLAENTLVIFSSDNGGTLDSNGPDLVHGCGDPDATNGHVPNGVLNGKKGNVFEGGTRVPTIARWPGHVAPGESAALMSQVDLLASLAALVGAPLPAEEAFDSQDQLVAWLGKDLQGREFILEQSNSGTPFGLRYREWKYLPYGGDKTDSSEMLFNLGQDIGEQNNVAAAHPEKVEQMRKKLIEILGETQLRAPKVKNKKKK
ncbi:sulfatase family protein [Pontiella sulfatireligans]|uniref:Arylsulfatase n=1 Tax=Pontiella sulfatireligans TaxID=2750658 RepID=A0A6C2UH57_9BACT|nr:arylsulfatase [Pontiella sulfatireligans]SPS74242.1 sulfatase S1_15 [Kiritimatiellales bacterium]VGO18751.1 Arylsulfatase [Pontiella sulfatireligans]